MIDEDEIDAFKMPENTRAEIIDKIDALADSIRRDWSDPRGELKRIKQLCEKLRNIE